MIQLKKKFYSKKIDKICFFILIWSCCIKSLNGKELTDTITSKQNKIATYSLKQLFDVKLYQTTEVIINSFFWGNGISPHPIFYNFLDSLSFAIIKINPSKVNIWVEYLNKENETFACERANFIEKYMERFQFNTEYISSNCRYIDRKTRNLSIKENYLLNIELVP